MSDDASLAAFGPQRFLNRELSWLDFDARVLALAEDPRVPLLERVKFLAIFSRNLDEFFQVRVAGLQDQAAADVGVVSSDGRSPREQLAAIRQRVVELTEQSQRLWAKGLAPALEDARVRVRAWDDLDDEDRAHLAGVYHERIFPVLTPLAVDPAHPFPHISDLSLNLAVVVRREHDGQEAFARVKVPPLLPRLLALPDQERFVPVEQVVAAQVHTLFPGAEILGCAAFRVTRDADLELRESEAVDLRQAIESSLRRRLRASDAVRLEVEAGFPAEARDLLVEELGLEAGEVYEVAGLLDLGDLMMLHQLDRPVLKDPAWVPRRVRALEDGEGGRGFFERLRAGDVLVHHPYESFDCSVEEFLEQAAADPDVLAIKQTLYRTGGGETGIVQALQRAASAGKQVVVLVELKARFDEQANLERARALEAAGAHVVYGVVGLKTHAKAALVIRSEPGGVRRTCHLGTGNYNPVTARLYEDLGLLTAAPEVTADVADLFNQLTSGTGQPAFRRLLVAPRGLRSGLVEEVEREIRAQRESGDGEIAIKVNGLSDSRMIDVLYEAAREGVRIDLVVRGICCLRPGVAGLSEGVRVRSILGRFLEHSRIFRFGSAARGRRTWIGSADLMLRNLDLRVESLVPLDDPGARRRVDEVLELCLHPDAAAWELDAGGAWHWNAGSLDVQERLIELTRERADGG